MNAFCLTRWEIRKLFARKRAWAGFWALGLFNLVFVLLLQHPDARAATFRIFDRIGYTHPDNFSGLTIAQFVLGHTLALVGAMFVALTTCDVVAKEDEDGLLRMILCRPVPRWRLLTSKLLACCIYLALLVAFAWAVSLVFGLWFEGRGQMLVMNHELGVQAAYSFEGGLLLYTWALGFLIISNFTVVGFSFSLSCAGMRPGIATVMTLFILAADDLLRHMPFFASFREWFIMSRIQAWIRVYAPGSDWSWIWKEYGPLMAINGIALAAGVIAFHRRDFKP